MALSKKDLQRIWRVRWGKQMVSLLIDTGATSTYLPPSWGVYLTDVSPSDTLVTVADGTVRKGILRGVLNVYVLDLDGGTAGRPWQFHATTVTGFKDPLLGLEYLYKERRYELYLQQPPRRSEMVKADSSGPVSYPIRFGWGDTEPGGWYLDIVIASSQKQCIEIGKMIRLDMASPCPERAKVAVSTSFVLHSELGKRALDVIEKSGMVESAMSVGDDENASLSDDSDSEETKELPEPMLYSIDGVKAGLRAQKRALNRNDFHRLMGHVGPDFSEKGCLICRMTKGSTRRIYHQVDAPRNLRAGHTWTLDTLIWSVTSTQGNSYANVLRDTVSGYVIIMYMKERSDIVEKLESVIKKMRLDPDFKNDGTFAVFSVIVCDCAGEFMESSKKMEELAGRLGFHMFPKSPDRHETLRRSENAVKLVETTIKSLLLTNNMPNEHHEYCSEDAEWLLNRLPLARNARKSTDQDAVRPIEELSGGRYSRRRIDRELHHYTPYGTIALVQQTKVRASDVGVSKVRWGYKQGQSRSGTPRWVCPVSGSLFHSKSFTAFHLRAGFNPWIFLGVESPKLGRNIFPKLRLSEIDQQLVIRFPGEIEKSSSVDPLIRSINSKQNGVKVSVVDKTGKVFAAGTDGVLKQTTYTAFDAPKQCSERGVLHSLVQQGVISPTWNTFDRVQAAHNQDIAALRSMPHSFIGRRFYKTFLEDGQTYVGEVKRYSANELPLPLWHVRYTDKDEEDFDENDMITYVIKRPVVQTTPKKLNPYVPPHKRSTQALQQAATGGSEVVDSDEGTHDDEIESDVNGKVTPSVGSPDTSFKYVVTKDNDTWVKVCKAVGVRDDLRKVYYQWLVDCHKMGHKADKNSRFEVYFPNPYGNSKKKTKFQPGIHFPIPSGPQWAGRADGYLDRCARANPVHEQRLLYEGSYAFARARHIVSAKLAQAHPPERARKAQEDFLIEFLSTVEHETKKIKEICAKAMESKLSPKEIKEIMTDEVLKMKPPFNRAEAVLRPDAQLWLEAIDTEFKTLDDMEVFVHDMTAADLLKLGIDIKKVKPVPMRLVLTVKFSPSGEYIKHKARCVIQGHPGNMQKGVHYNETFCASPCQDTTRILQALAAGLDLHRFAFDISLAYCWAKATNKIPVKYPQGYKRFNDKGEELFAVCARNLYGAPPASRAWSATRNAFFKKKFNEHGWSCTQSTYDPCLFVMKSPLGFRSWMLLFTDDADLVGESAADLKYIADCCHEEWKIRVCNPEHMLGVVRRKFKDNQGHTVIEMTMQSYVERMYEEYQQHLPKKTPSIPLEPNTFLSKTTDVASEEEKKEVLALGYQRVVGELLWATRNVFPEIAYGVNLLCRVMSSPSLKAWKIAMRIVAYLYTRRKCGIRFSSKAEPIVRTFVDSSNKPDPGDQKAQYGFVVTFFGGPVIWSTKKHAHIGMSAPHNEYMALTWAGRSTAWIKFLFEDMGIEEYVKDPIVIYEDNTAALKWSSEEYISEGNKFVLRPYFYINEIQDSKIVKVQWLTTDANIADLFTKAVKPETHNKLVGPLTGYGSPCVV